MGKAKGSGADATGSAGHCGAGENRRFYDFVQKYKMRIVLATLFKALFTVATYIFYALVRPSPSCCPNFGRHLYIHIPISLFSLAATSSRTTPASAAHVRTAVRRAGLHIGRKRFRQSPRRLSCAPWRYS